MTLLQNAALKKVQNNVPKSYRRECERCRNVSLYADAASAVACRLVKGDRLCQGSSTDQWLLLRVGAIFLVDGKVNQLCFLEWCRGCLGEQRDNLVDLVS